MDRETWLQQRKLQDKKTEDLILSCSAKPLASNPLLQFYEAADGKSCLTRGSYEARTLATQLWSWAVPNDEALVTIQRYAPIVEIGAGRGYWAAMLRSRGVDVKAYDSHPVPNYYNKVGEAYTAVHRGRARCAKRFAGHALFLCWPVYDDRMAADCLSRFKGDVVIYVGEGHGGCTGDDRFHEMLSAQFECIEQVDIPKWEGIHDWLTVWKRK